MLLKAVAELPEGCVSDLTFDAWYAGEFDAVHEAELARHVEGCAACAARQLALSRQVQRYLQRPDYDAQLARLSAERARRTSRRWLLPAALSAAAAVWLLFRAETPAFETRRKGAGTIGFYVRRGDAVFRGEPGQRVRPGDQLRFVWRSDRPVYLVILSVDAKRVVSTYYPEPGVQRPLVPSGGEIELPNAVELDATLGRERVFVVSCAEAPAVEQLRRTLATRGELQAAPGCELQRFDLFKEPPS